MKKVLIIEDELLSAKRLKKMILDIDDTLEVDGPLQSVKDVVEYMQAHDDYDLVFSDIRLLDGDVFMAFQKVLPSSLVIFTTAYDEYAMQAIKSNGIDYLLKPIDEDELREAMKKVGNLTSSNGKLKSVIDRLVRYKERLLVYKGGDMVSLPVNDILYFYKDGRNMLVTTSSGEAYCLSVTIQELESQLDPDKFFRLNRQYLVNIAALKKISPFFNSKLIVQLFHCSDRNIIVSKERAVLFKEWLNR